MDLAVNMQSAIAQGTLWGIMALGVYITFRILDIPDLSCEGTFALGGMHQRSYDRKRSKPFCISCHRIGSGNGGRSSDWIFTYEIKNPCDLSRYSDNDCPVFGQYPYHGTAKYITAGRGYRIHSGH